MTLLHHGLPAPPRTPTAVRSAAADNLKVVLVIGVILAHATMAWTELGTWVVREPSVREPLLSLLTLVTGIVALFGIPVFLFLAGTFTPASLRRKGPGRFVLDRLVRLGVPMVFFIVFLSPIVEYVDTDNVGWTEGFPAFTSEVWWPPAPGPTWFLGVLLLFSVVYAGLRRSWPLREPASGPLRAWYAVAMVAALMAASFSVRLAVPLGEERWRLALGQAPAWVAAFAIGVIGAERGWFAPIAPTIARWARRLGCTALVVGVGLFVAVVAVGWTFDDFAGGVRWHPLVMAAIEAVLVVAMPVWLLDVFRRRFDHQGRVAREASRAAYAAFVLHQVVLVGAVLVTRLLPWSPELEYVLAGMVGIVGSFALAAAVVRLPGVSRVV